MTQGLDTRGSWFSFCRQSYLAIHQTQIKAACRPSSYMGLHTKNEIYLLGGRRAVPQAGAWSYSRRESGTDGQEGGASLLRDGQRMNPTTGSGAPKGKVKLALPPTEGGAFPDLLSLVCHRNIFSERRVLIVGEDVQEHGFEVTTLVIDHYFWVG